MTWSQCKQTHREAAVHGLRVAVRPGSRRIVASAFVACLIVAAASTVAAQTAPVLEHCTEERFHALALERVTVREVWIRRLRASFGSTSPWTSPLTRS